MVVNLTVSNIIVQPELNAAQITITPTFSSGEGGGVTNYEALSNLPKINGVELRGNKTAKDLGLQPEGDYATNAQLANKKNIIEPNVVYGNLNLKFKDVIWEDGFVKIAVTSPINQTQTYPHIGLRKVIVTKCKIDLGNGLFDLKPIVTYPSAPTKLNTFTWMYFLLSDVDGRLTENTDFTALDLSYELWPDVTLKLDTKTLLGENVVSEHQVSDAGHSEATIKTFNAIYPEFTGEKYRSELDALTLGLIPEIFTPTYCDKRDVNLIIKPYSNVGEEESIGSNPNILTVVSHSGNDFLRYDNGLTSPDQFFENTILVGSRINDATTQSGTSFGFGMEFFEPGNNVGLSALAPTKQFKIVLGFSATTIGNVVNFGTDISKRFRVGDICIIGQDDNTDEQRTITQVNGSFQVIVDSPYSINYITNQWYSILGDLGTLWQADFTNLSYYQSPICAVVGAKLKKIRIATGANWQLVRKVARLTASNANNWDMYRGFGIIDVDAAINYIELNYKSLESRALIADKLESKFGISNFLEYSDLLPNSPVSKKLLSENFAPIPTSEQNYLTSEEKESLWNRNAGACEIPTIVENGDGNITIGAGSFCVYNNIQGSGIIKKYNFAGGILNLTNGVSNYIVGDYNGGVPIVKVITDILLINESTVVPIYSIFRNGIYLHRQNWDALAENLANKIHRSIVKTQKYRRQEGLALSEFGTRNLSLTSGILYVGAVETIVSAIDSTIDNIFEFVKIAGVWTQRIKTQYNNLEYQNGADVATLTSNRYAVNWIFRGIEENKHLYIILGAGDYTQLQAENAVVPEIPINISSHGLLVAKLIVQKSANTATSILGAFERFFSYAPATEHNNTTGIQGGAVGDYQHLTTAEKDSLNNSFLFNNLNAAVGAAIYPLIQSKQNSILGTLVNGVNSTLTIEAPTSGRRNETVLHFSTNAVAAPTFIYSGFTPVWLGGTALSMKVSKKYTIVFEQVEVSAGVWIIKTSWGEY